MAEEKISTDVDDWLNDLDDAGDAGGDLEQSDIDSLLGGAAGDAGGGAPAVAEEMDQSAIDSLLGAGGDDSGAASTGLDLDQSDIDNLFASGADSEEETSAPAAEVDFGELLDSGAEKESAAGSGAADFSPEEFTLEPADFQEAISDLPPPAPPAPPAPPEPPLRTRIPDPSPAEATMAAAAVASGAAAGSFFARHRNLLAGGVLLLLLVAGGAFYFLRGGKPEIPHLAGEQPAAVAPHPAPSVPIPEPKVNQPPVAASSHVELAGPGATAAIGLAGSDDDGDPLVYELIEFPAAGRLAGRLPSLNYLPDAAFPGHDRLSYRVTDGKSFSSVAEVVISGPIAAAKPAEPPSPAAAAPPKKKDVPAVTAKASSRLKKDGKVLAKKKAAIAVEAGDRPPELHIAPVAKAAVTGETVIVNASASRDDQRAGLVFAWQQVAGATVALKPMNREGSIVSFVMPAFFSNETNPQVTLEVTAVDQAGNLARQAVSVQSVSRRGQALWDGIASR